MISEAFTPASPSHEVGNAHYAKLAIDPFTYSMENKLDALQHTIVKYVTRFRDKGGLRDLLEARNTIDRLIQFDYPHHKDTHEGNAARR